MIGEEVTVVIGEEVIVVIGEVTIEKVMIARDMGYHVVIPLLMFRQQMVEDMFVN